MLVIFQIILIIDVYVDPNYVHNTSNLLFATYYISIIGVVFATSKPKVLTGGLDLTWNNSLELESILQGTNHLSKDLSVMERP